MSKLLLVFGLLLALALSALANPTDVCIRAVFPRLITECELLPKNSLHTGSNSSGINLRTAVQDIVACFSDLNQSLSILAPNVSSTSFARAQIGYLQQQRQQATNATPAHVDFTLTGMATWGRTLAQIGGVAPGFVGLAANATVDETYDAWLVDPIALADLYDSGLTLDLSHLVLDDSYREQIQWVGIHQLLRASVVVAEGSVAALPFGGLVYQMYYRRDVLAAHGLDPPATWDEFLAAAQRVNGTDMNEDGQPDYGVCLQRARYCWNSFSLVSIWSSFIQSEGTQQGAFFDPATMQPLVNNSAMREALRIYRALQDYGPPDEVSAPCQVFNEHFVRGRCALTLSWGYQFKANTFLPYSYVRDRASVALLPGSTRVLNRTSGQLQPCSSTLVCPYAQETPAAGSTSSSSSSNGSSSSSSTPAATTTTRLVNRAPYLALASVSVAVSTRSSAQQQTHLLDMFAYLSSRNVSWDLVTSSTTELGPYRYEHFDTANLDQWVRRGYPGAAVREFLSVMKAQLDSPNVLLEVRTLDAYAYRHLLDTFATQLSEAGSGASGGSSSGTGDPSAEVDSQVQAALQGLAEALNEVYMGGGGGSINATRAAARRRYYLYSIGLTSESDWMPPQLDDGSSTASSSSSSRLRTVVPLAVVVPVLVVLFVTAGAAAVWFNAVREKRREEAQAPKGPPGLGEDTTLMVSDVEGSTALWEVIKPEVMDVVFNLHHDCMRRTAVRFGGYESQTEGDSFIIAFHCADSAVQFALAVQQALLDEPWPWELLAHEKCRPVWLVRTGAEVPLDVPLEPTAVAPPPPPPPPLPVQRANGNGFEHSGGRLTVPHGTVSCDGSPGAATPSGSRLDLRRLVAWRGNSRWRVNSVADSLGDGGQTRRQSGAGDLGPAAGGQDVSVSGGVAAFADDRSAHGSVHEEVIAPVFSTTGMTIGALPVRYSSVADALRAMWREVNVSAPDPWAHNGGGMGLGRWQNVKTALRTSMSSRISVATAAAALASAMPAAAADAPPSFVRSRSLPARTQDARGRLGTTSPRLTSVGHGLLGGDGAAAAAAVSDVEDDAAQRCFSDNGHGHAVEEEAPPQLPLPGASRFCSTSSTAAAAMQNQITQERGSGGSLAASNAAAAFASAHPLSLGRRLAATVTGLGMARSASGRTDPSGFAMSQTATTLQTSRFTPSTPPLRASLKHLLLRTTQQQSHHPRPMSQPQPHVAPQSQTTTPHQGPPQYHLRHTSGGHLAPPFGLEHAEERAAAPPEQCTLVRRGLMVRIGLHSGVRHMTDLQYSEVAARWKYSGEILAAAKAVSDAANGGDVFISAACLSRLGHDFLSKRCRLLYLGRHVLRGGDPAAAAAAAAASHDPPQPAPGAVAELYAVYSPKLLPRLGLYRPPRTAQSLGMSALEAPLGRVAYGVVMCHNLAEMALHHESIPASVVSEAKTALGSITADQLLACHGVMAAPSPHCGVGAVAGAFRNPYHAVLWALQSQEDLLRHPWSQEMLSQEQFEAIVVPEAAADALVSPNTAPTLRRGGPWGQELAEEQLRGAPGVPPPPPYSGGGAGGGGSRGTGDGDANSTATDPGGASAAPPPLPAWAAVTQAQTRSERSLLSCEDGVTGAAGAGATAAPTQAAGLMVSDPSSICGSNSVRGLSSLPSWTRSSAPGGAATVAAARLGPPRSATTTAVVACSASIASQTGAAGLAAAAAPSTGSSYNPVAATMPRCESTIEICTTDGERESIPARPTPSGLSGWSSSVMAAAGTSIYGPNPSPTSPPQPSHPPPPPPPQLQAHASCGAVAQQQWPVSDDSNPKCPPALPPAQAAQGSVTVTGMGPASAAVPVTGEVVLFRGPRIKGVITFGALKASLDPLTGRVRYEGKAVSQAVKMMSYAAIGMVVASVEAVEAGHVEDSEAEGTPGGGGGGGGRAAGTVPSGCTPRQVSTATEPPDDKQRQCSMTLRLPAPVRPASPPPPPQLTISRTDSFLNDPEGPSAAMAAAAKAAAAALLNLAPSGGSFVQGGSASSSRRSIPLDSLSRRDSLAQLAAALGAPNGAGLANSGPLSRRRSPARAHRKKRTSDATDAADAPSGPLIMAADGAGGSHFPSGYSTPASGPSYSYTHNPLYGTGAGSGAASPLRPDSRAHSRTAVRALSNLNPDSRQGSRTMMHRTSGLSVPAGPAQYQPPLPPAQLQQLLRPLAAARRRRASKVTRGPSAHAHMERDASGTNGVCSTPTSPVAAAATPGEHHARAAGALPKGSPLWVGSPPSGAVDAFLRTSHGPPLATSRRSRRSHGSDASSISDAPRDPSTRALRSAAAATAVATADPAKEGSIGSSGDCGSPPLTPRRLPVGLEVAPLRRRRRASRRLHAHPAAAAAPLPLASSPRSQGLRLGPEPQPPSDSLTGSGAETGHERHVRPPVPRPSGQVVAATLEETVTAAQPAAEAESAAIDACDCSFPTSLPMPPAPAIPPQQQQQLRSEAAARVSGSGGGCDSGGSLGRANGEEPAPEPRGRRSQDLPQGALLPTVGEDCSLNHTLGAIARGRTSSLRRSSALGSAGKRCSSLRRGDAPTGVPLLIAVGRSSSLRVSDSSSPFPLVSSAPLDALRQQQQQQLPSPILMLQQRDSERVFPCTGHTTTSGLRSAAVLPSVQVLSLEHGPGPHIQSPHHHHQHPLHHHHHLLHHLHYNGSNTHSAGGDAGQGSSLGGTTGGGASGVCSSSAVVLRCASIEPEHHYSSSGLPAAAAGPAPQTPTHGSAPQVPWPGSSSSRSPMAPPQQRSEFAAAAALASPSCQRPSPGHWAQWPAATTSASFLNAGARIGSGCGMNGAALTTAPAAINIANASSAFGSNGGAGGGVGAAVCLEAGAPPTVALRKTLDVGLDQVVMLPVALKKRGSSQPLVVYLCRFASSARMCEMQQRLVTMGHGDTTAAAAAAVTAAAAAAATIASGNASLTTAAATEASFAAVASSMTMEATPAGIVSPLPYNKLSDGLGTSGLAPAPAVAAAAGTSGGAAAGSHMLEKLDWKHVAGLFSGTVRHASHDSAAAAAAGSHLQPPGAAAHLLPLHVPGQAVRRASLTGFIGGRGAHDMLSRRSMNLTSRAGCCDNNTTHAQLASPSVIPHLGPLPPLGGNVVSGGSVAISARSASRGAGLTGGGGGGGSFMRRLRRASVDITSPKRRQGLVVSALGHALYGGVALPQGEVRTMNVKRVQRATCVSGPAQHLLAALPPPQQAAAAAAAANASTAGSTAGSTVTHAAAASATLPYINSLYSTGHHTTYGVGTHGPTPSMPLPRQPLPSAPPTHGYAATTGSAGFARPSTAGASLLQSVMRHLGPHPVMVSNPLADRSAVSCEDGDGCGTNGITLTQRTVSASQAEAAVVAAVVAAAGGSNGSYEESTGAAAAAAAAAAAPTSYENPSATPSITLSVIAGGGGGGGGGGNTAAAAPAFGPGVFLHSTSTSSQQLIIVGAANNSNGGQEGAAGGGSGSIGSLWEFSGLQAAFRATGGGRTTPQRSRLMTPTEEGHETDGEGGCE